MHSTTKFLNGHSDSIGGVLISGKEELSDSDLEQVAGGATLNLSSRIGIKKIYSPTGILGRRGILGPSGIKASGGATGFRKA